MRDPVETLLEQTWRAVCRVWASKWNDRAYLSRRARGIAHDSLQMAVLIQEVVPAEYAFVIHTANPLTGARDEIFAEVVDNHYLPAARAQDCAFEYGALAWAFDGLIKPHIDQPLARNVLDSSWLPAVTFRPTRPGHPPAQ